MTFKNRDKEIIDKGYDESLKILGENLEILHHIANVLMESESIDSTQLDEIFKLYEKPMDCAT